MMKINRLIALLACTMAFTACQDDMQEASMLQNKIYTLTGNMSGGNTMSRAQIVLGNDVSGSGETAYWNEGDKFSLYQPNENGYWNEYVFSISDEYKESEKNPSVTFSTEIPVEPGSYVAVYPANRTVVNNGSVTCSITNDHTYPISSSNYAEGLKDYFKQNMFMLSKGTLTEGGNNDISFDHLTSLFRISYTNLSNETQVIKGISLGGDQHFRLWNSYSLENGDIVEQGGTTNDYNTWYEGLTLDSGGTGDFYIFFFPTAFNEGELHISVIVGEQDRKTVKIPMDYIKEKSQTEGFIAQKRYWFRISDNGRYLYLDNDYTDEVVTIDNVELSLALKDVLEQKGISVELDPNTGYAKINKMDVNSVTDLDLNLKSIPSLKGIEHFSNLKNLQCIMAGLTEADFSQNVKLENLTLENNNLQTLTLGNLPNLEKLYCKGNQSLKELDLSGCNALLYLDLQYCPLQNLDIPNPEILSDLQYSNTQINIATEEWEKFTSLKVLGCSACFNGELNIPASVKGQLTNLYCNNNKLTDLNLSEFPQLTVLECAYNQLTSLNLEPAKGITNLNIGYNSISSLDITPLTGLVDLVCNDLNIDGKLQLTLTEIQANTWNEEWATENNVELNVKSSVIPNVVTIKNAELTDALIAVLGKDTVKIDPDYGYGLIDGNIVLEIEELNFNDYEGTIASLNNGIEFFINLTRLECRDVKLQTCDLKYNTQLTYVDVQSNQLETLDLTGCGKLQELFCQYNEKLNSLILDEKAALWNLQAQGTALTEWDIPNPKAMNNLLLPAGLQINDWTTFAETFSNLTGLGLEGRNLDGLNIIEGLKGQLSYLNVQNNNLKELDLKEFPSLRQLDCGWNQLKGLNLSDNTNLEHLNCMGNQMTELDISPLTDLLYLSCGYQYIEAESMLLKLTSAQMEIWEEKWKNNGGNGQVTTEVSDTNQ